LEPISLRELGTNRCAHTIDLGIRPKTPVLMPVAHLRGGVEIGRLASAHFPAHHQQFVAGKN
jgi:hypothetical protein